MAGILFWPRAEPADSDPPPADAAEVPDDPLLVAVHTADGICGHNWMTSKSPEELTLPPSDVYLWDEWDLVADGVSVRQNHALLTVHGSGTNSVVINDLRINVVDRAQPMTGTQLSGRCGDGDYMRIVDVDLDEPNPRVVGRELSPEIVELAQRNGWRTSKVEFPYEVSAQDSETFAVIASTETCDCSFTVELSWSSGGRTGTTVVDDGGKPFRVTADTETMTCDLTSYPLPCEVR